MCSKNITDRTIIPSPKFGIPVLKLAIVLGQCTSLCDKWIIFKENPCTERQAKRCTFGSTKISKFSSLVVILILFSKCKTLWRFIDIICDHILPCHDSLSFFNFCREMNQLSKRHHAFESKFHCKEWLISIIAQKHSCLCWYGRISGTVA